MFTTLDLIKDIINNNFINTNKITKTFIREIIKQEELRPVSEQQLNHRQDYCIRKQFNIFNKNKLNVVEKQIKTFDEINKLYYINMFLCENDIHDIIFEPGGFFKVNFVNFFNIKKYETSNEIKYTMYCRYWITLSGDSWHDTYKLSFVINKNIKDLNKVLQIDELYLIKRGNPLDELPPSRYMLNEFSFL